MRPEAVNPFLRFFEEIRDSPGRLRFAGRCERQLTAEGAGEAQHGRGRPNARQRPNNTLTAKDAKDAKDCFDNLSQTNGERIRLIWRIDSVRVTGATATSRD